MAGRLIMRWRWAKVGEKGRRGRRQREVPGPGWLGIGQAGSVARSGVAGAQAGDGRRRRGGEAVSRAGVALGGLLRRLASRRYRRPDAGSGGGGELGRGGGQGSASLVGVVGEWRQWPMGVGGGCGRKSELSW